MENVSTVRQRLNRTLWEKLTSNWFVGTVGILSGFLSVYDRFFPPTPTIAVEVTEEGSRFLDALSSSGSKVLKGIYVVDGQRDLRLVNISVRNDSTIDIPTNFFDQRRPLSFTIDNGKILGAFVGSATSNWLAEDSAPSKIEGSRITFVPFNFNRTDYFTVKLLVESAEPGDIKVSAHGSILGIRLIDIYRGKDLAWWKIFARKFVRDPVVFILKAIGYIMAIIFGFFFAMMSGFGVANRITRRNINKKLEKMELTLSKEQLESLEYKALKILARSGEPITLSNYLPRSNMAHPEWFFRDRAMNISGYRDVVLMEENGKTLFRPKFLEITDIFDKI